MKRKPLVFENDEEEVADDPTDDRAEYDESVNIPMRKLCPACDTPLTTYWMEGEEAKQVCEKCNLEWVLDHAINMIDRPRKKRRR